MKEVIVERIKAKAINDKNPLKFSAGISIHLLTNPGYVKKAILNSFTTKVAR